MMDKIRWRHCETCHNYSKGVCSSFEERLMDYEEFMDCLNKERCTRGVWESGAMYCGASGISCGGELIKKINENWSW